MRACIAPSTVVVAPAGSVMAMSRMRRALHREATRHSVAMTVAGVVSFVVLVATAFIGDDPDVRLFASAGVTLVFGLYGPVFLLLTRIAFGTLRGDGLRSRLRRSEESSRLVRVLFLGGARSWAMLVAMMGIVAVLLLTQGDARSNPWLVASSVACVVGTWLLLVGVFTVEYMRTWANDDSLEFPGDQPPGITDFVYLSVQLSTTFSSSDVTLVTSKARSLATAHSLAAFAYSTVIIAVFASLLISTAA